METLKNPVEVKVVVWGNVLFILIVMVIGVFLSPMAGAVLFGTPIGLMYGRHQSLSHKAKVFLNTDQILSSQKTESYLYYQQIASAATWFPVFGIFFCQEKFSSLLCRLRERYESTYWKAYLEVAYHEATEGKIGGDFIQWLKGDHSDDKREATLNVLGEVEHVYHERLEEWREKARKQKEIREKEEKVVSSGSIGYIREFYRRYTPLPEGAYYRGLKRAVEVRTILRCVQEAEGEVKAKCSLERITSLVQGIWDLILYQDAPVQFAKTMRIVFAPEKIIPKHAKE